MEGENYMKKAFSLLLVFVLLFSVVGCGESGPTEEEIKDELVGKWCLTSNDGTLNRTMGWIFYEDGIACSYVVEPASYGKYEIREDRVYLTYDNGASTYFEFAFEDGEFKLKGEDSEWWNLTKI